MFNLLFTNFLDLQRHEQASFSEQRQAYLHKLHADGMGIRHLRGLAGLLIAIDELLALRESDTFEIPLEYIVQKTSEWDSMTRQQRCDMRVEVNFHCRFLGASKRWLTYWGRLDHRYYPEDNIISKIFPRGYFRVRHLVSPMYMERLAYLEAQEQQGVPSVTLRRIAQYQLTAIELLDLPSTSLVTMSEIQNAAAIWRDVEDPSKRKKSGTDNSYRTFIHVTTNWLSHMGLLAQPEEHDFPEKDKIMSYLNWLVESKGYSVQTHRSRLSILRHLMNYLQGSSLLLADVQSTDIDSFLKERHYNGCNRRTIAGLVSVLRCFFRYAADRQWVKDDLWKTLSAPRLYTMEQLPSYLHWDDVKVILTESTRNPTIQGIRNHAILSLLAMYGLRSSEITELRLKDIDWRNSVIHLRRAKGCRPQVMPLIDEVAQPLLRYILEARPKYPKQEFVFLTTRAPFHGICTSTVYQVASRSLEGRQLNIRHHGPHSYRHSCATRLVNEGHSLKEVADVLGHVKIDTTAIYAKVNFSRLREVSDMDWKEVLEL